MTSNQVAGQVDDLKRNSGKVCCKSEKNVEWPSC